MTRSISLQQLSRSAVQGATGTPAITDLVRTLFDPPEYSFWNTLYLSTKEYLEPELAEEARTTLLSILPPIADGLVAAEGMEGLMLYRHLTKLEKQIRGTLAPFWSFETSSRERRGALLGYAPLALIQLTILKLLKNLSAEHDPKATECWEKSLSETVAFHLTFAGETVILATAWRTEQLEIAWLPLTPSHFGAPTLQLRLKDALTDRTIVNEACAVYPGKANPQFQRSVDRIATYEQRLHFKTYLFWENRTLNILSEWSEDISFEAPPAPNTMDELLDDALFHVMQTLSNTMMRGV